VRTLLWQRSAYAGTDDQVQGRAPEGDRPDQPKPLRQRLGRLLLFTLGLLLIMLGLLLVLSRHPPTMLGQLRDGLGAVLDFLKPDLRWRLGGLVLIVLGVLLLLGLSVWHWELLRFVAALGAVLVGLLLLWDIRQSRPVAAAFSRVGGPTRVETAVEASRFWRTPPAYVVTTKADQPREIMLGAAQCAMVLDAPLLFTSRDQGRQRLVNRTIRELRPNARPGGPPRREKFAKAVNDERAIRRCLDPGNPSYDGSNADGVSTLDVSNRELDLPVRTQEKLPRVVVFAVAKTPRDPPDVAVGLALAAHLATANGQVSLIVVPRHLESHPELETVLRKRRELVTGGIVLGETGILPEDTRALLRQVLTSTGRSGFLGELRSTLQSFEALIPVLLALLGAGIVAQSAPKVVVQLVGGRPIMDQAKERIPWITSKPKEPHPPEPPPAEPYSRHEAWTAVPSSRQVTVWLRSGWRITGINDTDNVPRMVLKLNEARIAREGRDKSEHTADSVYVLADDIELVSVGRGSQAEESRQSEGSVSRPSTPKP
jgi:hypothetical protein